MENIVIVVYRDQKKPYQLFLIVFNRPIKCMLTEDNSRASRGMVQQLTNKHNIDNNIGRIKNKKNNQ